MKLTNEQVRHLRIYHGMSLKEFAARIGTGYVTIHRIERGDLNISESMRERIVEEINAAMKKLTAALLATEE